MFALFSGFRFAHLLQNAFKAAIDKIITVEREEKEILHQDMSGSMMDKLHFTSKDKRRSLPSGLSPPARKGTPKNTPKNSPRIGPVAPAKLSIDYESPPLVFYGSPMISTGAILSGQLKLTVLEAEIIIQAFEMELVGKVITKKPVSKDCPECSIKTTEIKQWVFLHDPVRYKLGKYSFPFSYLVPGHLPTTSHGSLGDIEYELRAHAKTSLSESIRFTRILTVQRALQPGRDRTCSRIFPPTNIISTVIFPPTIHPIGEFPVQIRVAGIANKQSQDHVLQRWRVRKLSWRITEHAHIISPACAKHSHKLGPVAGTSGAEKGLLHQLSRDIGHGEIKHGWKTDLDANQTETEIVASISPAARPVCDVTSPTGFEASHTLVLELIVAEEQVVRHLAKSAALPTGRARALRMHFGLTVTERAGLGISWDEEQPPTYDDVPVSPPGYARLEEYSEDPIPYEELELMQAE